MNMNETAKKAKCLMPYSNKKKMMIFDAFVERGI